MSNKAELGKLLSDLRKVQEQEQELAIKINNVQEKIMDDDEYYFKGICIQCNATGWIQEKEKKIVCPLCDGKRYIWIRKFEE